MSSTSRSCPDHPLFASLLVSAGVLHPLDSGDGLLLYELNGERVRIRCPRYRATSVDDYSIELVDDIRLADAALALGAMLLLLGLAAGLVGVA